MAEPIFYSNEGRRAIEARSRDKKRTKRKSAVNTGSVGALTNALRAVAATAAPKPISFTSPLSAGPDFSVGRNAEFDVAGQQARYQANPLNPPLNPEAAIDAALARYAAAMPAPNPDAYLGPYNRAESAVRATAADARPRIEQTYDTLVNSLEAGKADLAAATGQNRVELANTLGAQVNQVGQYGQDAVRNLQLQGVDTGSVLSNVAQESALRQSQLQAGANSALNLSDRLAQVRQQGSDARIADVGGAKANASASLDLNLQRALTDIDMGKAKAQQELAQATEARARELFNVEQSLRSDQAKQQVDFLKAAAENAEQRRKNLEQEEKNRPTPRQQFEANYEQYQHDAPEHITAFEIFTDPLKGSGPMTTAKALRALEENREALENGTFVIDDETGDTIGKSVDVDTLARWIRQFYDDGGKSRA